MKTVLLVLVVSLGFISLTGCSNAPWEKAQKKDTIKHYEKFIEENPTNSKVDEARMILDSLYYQKAGNEGTIDGYKAYIEKFPEGRFVKEAHDDIETLVYESAVASKNVEALKLYQQQYPEGAYKDFIANDIETASFNKAKELNTVEALREYLAVYPQGQFIGQATVALAALGVEIDVVEEKPENDVEEAGEAVPAVDSAEQQ